MKKLFDLFKKNGFSKIVKSNYVSLYLKPFDNRVFYGVSFSKDPRGISIAFGLFDSAVMAEISKVEGIEDLNLIDLTYKKLFPSTNEHTIEKHKIERYFEEIEIRLKQLDGNIENQITEYKESLCNFIIPDCFVSEISSKDNMMGLYYGLINSLIIKQGDTSSFESIIAHNLPLKKKNNAILFKIELIMKYLKTENK